MLFLVHSQSYANITTISFKSIFINLTRSESISNHLLSIFEFPGCRKVAIFLSLNSDLFQMCQINRTMKLTASCVRLLSLWIVKQSIVWYAIAPISSSTDACLNYLYLAAVMKTFLWTSVNQFVMGHVFNTFKRVPRYEVVSHMVTLCLTY